MGGKKRPKKIVENERKSIDFLSKFHKFSGLETSIPEGTYRIRKSLLEYQLEWFHGKKTGLYHQRAFVFIKNASKELPDYLEVPHEEEELMNMDDIDTELMGSDEISDINIPMPKENPIQTAIEYHLKKIIEICEINTFVIEKICGTLLFMGDYSLLIIESPEVLLVDFFNKIIQQFGEFWKNNKLFLIDDNISEYNFKKFTTHKIPAIFINEKFQPNTENDEYLMAKEHRSITTKLRGLVNCLARMFELESGEEATEEAEGESREHESGCDNISSDLFKKLIPEIQRMELVLNSKRFYPPMDRIPDLQKSLPIDPEEDELYWPIMNNYTPLGVYMKSKFDYNLTYPESNEAVEEGGQQGVGDDEAEEGSEEEEGEAVGTSEAASAGNVSGGTKKDNEGE